MPRRPGPALRPWHASRRCAWPWAASPRRPIREPTAAPERKLPEPVLRRLVYTVGDGLESRVPADWLWLSRHVKMGDGTTLLTPDTDPNQEVWPQQRGAEARPGVSHPADGRVDLLGHGRLVRPGDRTVQGQGDGRDRLAARVAGPFPTRRRVLGRLRLLFVLHAGVVAGAGRGRGDASTPGVGGPTSAAGSDWATGTTWWSGSVRSDRSGWTRKPMPRSPRR